jgi:glycosyltransferase involved in cell wall biosynthesis
MTRYANLITTGCRERGHAVRVATARPLFVQMSRNTFVRKWLGYADKFILFQLQLKKVEASLPPGTLVVCLDQTLAPWLPAFRRHPSVTHVHDLISLKAALGEFPNITISATGKLYNRYILQGLKASKAYICISQATNLDVRRILQMPATSSYTVYNGIQGHFTTGDCAESRKHIESLTGLDLSKGFILHVGADVWYKNRLGVIHVYQSFRARGGEPLPLLLVGPNPSGELALAIAASSYRSDIRILTDVDDIILPSVYQGARLLLFPSITEGFGWPIAEALACGCPVVTTDAAPMTEVGKQFAHYIPCMPPTKTERAAWVETAVDVVARALIDDTRSMLDRSRISEAIRGEFAFERAMDAIEDIYKEQVFESAQRPAN